MSEEVELDSREDHEKLEELPEEHKAEVKAGSWLRWKDRSVQQCRCCLRLVYQGRGRHSYR